MSSGFKAVLFFFFIKIEFCSNKMFNFVFCNYIHTHSVTRALYLHVHLIYTYYTETIISCISDDDAKAECSSEEQKSGESPPQTNDRPHQQCAKPETSIGSLRSPEQPDMADHSSQFSFTWHDGTGKQKQNSPHQKMPALE